MQDSASSRVDPYILGNFIATPGSAPTVRFSSTATRRRYAPSEIPGTIKSGVFLGDSVLANSGPTLYTTTQANNYNLNNCDGAIYHSEDPMLGCSNGWFAPYFSCPIAPLGDAIITGGYCTSFISVLLSMGSTKIRDFARRSDGFDGSLNQDILVAALRLANIGISQPNFVMYGGGPNDNTFGTPQADWAAAGASVIATIRSRWPTVPILFNKCTKSSGTNSTSIQNAQTGLIDHPNGIWAGVDSDGFSSGDFEDGTHYSAIGGHTTFPAAAVTAIHAAGGI